MLSDDTLLTSRVISLLTERLGMPPETITADADLIEDLGVDSVDAVEFMLALEGEFQVAIPDHRFAELRTVRDVVDLLR
jgi:acyl carrier protein